MKIEARAYIIALAPLCSEDLKMLDNFPLYLVFGETQQVKDFIQENKNKIIDYHFELWANKSLQPLYDLTQTKARIEPGAIIRNHVQLADTAIVLMGAVINLGAVIGEYTMVDMNAVVGSNAQIGANCHIGAGAVIAGTLEPKGSKPVVIEDGCLIGANATILAGVTIHQGAIVGAGAVVTKDVKAKTTVVGIPAKEIKENQEWQLNEELRYEQFVG